MPAAANKPLELAGIRVAWREAKAELLKLEEKTRRGASNAEELDEALEQAVQEDLISRFGKLYAIQLSVHLHPADALLARIYRELQSNLPTVISVTKVKSLFQANQPVTEQRISLSANVSVRVDEPETLPVKSIVEYCLALRTLGNAYAMAGSYEAPSFLDPNKKVRMCPLQVQLDYADFVLRMSASGEASVSWVRERDEATRGRMIELMRQNWPQVKRCTGP